MLDPNFISILTNFITVQKLKASRKNEVNSLALKKVNEIISEGLNRMLEKAWHDLMPITLLEQSREVNHSLLHL